MGPGSGWVILLNSISCIFAQQYFLYFCSTVFLPTFLLCLSCLLFWMLLPLPVWEGWWNEPHHNQRIIFWNKYVGTFAFHILLFWQVAWYFCMLVFLAPFSSLSHVKSFERFFRWSCGRQLLHHHYWLLYGILCARRHTYYLLFQAPTFCSIFSPL